MSHIRPRPAKRADNYERLGWAYIALREERWTPATPLAEKRRT